MRRILLLLGVVALALTELTFISTPAHAAPAAGVNKWAVVIGTDHFVKGNPTHSNVGSRGDALDVYSALRNSGWPESHIRLLVDQAATQAAIRDAMKWLRDNADDTSFSVFHYSGHVLQRTDKKDRDKDGEITDEFLWPADASSRAPSKYIMDNELASNMRAVKGWLWVDISGCEAAGLNDGIAASNRLFTASSQENEKSYEDPNWHNSIFTGLMVDRGMSGGMADTNHDGFVHIQEAFNWAAQGAPQYTAHQKNGPQHPYLAGGDGRDWFLVPPPPPPPPPPAKPAPAVRGKSCVLKVCI